VIGFPSSECVYSSKQDSNLQEALHFQPVTFQELFSGKNEGCGQSFKNNPFVLDHLHSHCTYTAVCSFLLFFDEKMQFVRHMISEV
jgi:hypothetical protein